MRKKLIIVTGCLLACVKAFCDESQNRKEAVNTNTVPYLANNFKPSQEVIYKKINGQKLKLHIFDPEDFKAGDSRPCFLVIHGGGWVAGSAKDFYPFAVHYAKLGFVGISIDYRLMKKGSSITPFDCVKDGRSAVRYVRGHVAELGIDPHKIIVSGGSAGGHVAACTALCEGIDESGEDTSISCMPDALVLYWPVLDTSPEYSGHAKFGERWKEISPLNLVRAGMPPTIVFQGSADRLVSSKSAQEFHDAMLKAGDHCELVVEPSAGHGYMMWDLKFFYKGMQRSDGFLASFGYLQ